MHGLQLVLSIPGCTEIRCKAWVTTSTIYTWLYRDKESSEPVVPLAPEPKGRELFVLYTGPFGLSWMSQILNSCLSYML